MPDAGCLNRIETAELEELALHIKHADIELIQIRPTQSSSSLIRLSLDNINLQIGSYGSGCISNATSDRERYGLLYKIDRETPTKCNGHQLDNRKFLVYGNNTEHFAFNEGPCTWSYITISPSYFEECILDPIKGKLKTSTGAASCLTCGNLLSIDSFRATVREIARLAEGNAPLFENRDIRKGIEHSVLEIQLAVLSRTLDAPAARNKRGSISHEFIIKRSIDFLKANSYEPLHLLDLCSALGVKMRTLYYAFQEFYGISPIKYLRLVRYAGVRRDLINADPKRTTVTEIAVRWHFWHFGRFSVEYKSLYDESPSATLSKAGPR
ncbi:MAG TPA: helix-turn-helix domain-containing protein [Thermodesulfobacteriota bacterium]|nr:helix-turn-helix domain-containing protein [Thermodesulfobacteriota bacterium]